MSQITTANFQQALKPLVRDWFGEYENQEKLYSRFMEVMRSNDAYEEDTLVSGFGLASAQAEGARALYDTAQQGYTKRYDHILYSNGFKISHQMMINMKSPMSVQMLTRHLRKGLDDTVEQIAADVLNDGFSDASGGDGVVLFSNAHPTLAGNQSNVPTTLSDLSEAALEQADIDIRNMKNNRGLKINIKPKTLVIPVEYRHEANRILNSSARVGVADNDLNSLSSLNVVQDVVVNPFLEDTDAWYLTTTAPQGLRMNMREDIQLKDDNDFDTFAMKVLGYFNLSVGHTDWRGAYASDGSA